MMVNYEEGEIGEIKSGGIFLHIHTLTHTSRQTPLANCARMIAANQTDNVNKQTRASEQVRRASETDDDDDDDA